MNTNKSKEIVNFKNKLNLLFKSLTSIAINVFKKINTYVIFFKSKNDIKKLRSNIKKLKFYTTYSVLSEKKIFCILEQGNSSNNRLTSIRKKLFNTDFSDVKRLNWANNREDKLADYFSEKKICWSEGRSYLYEMVKGKYSFYIFIDDDIDILLRDPKEDIAVCLKNQLLKYKPIHGSFPNNQWPKKYFINNYGEAFKMKGGDLCVQLFRDDFASLMFPTWMHGSSRSMWYAQYIAHILFPNESLYLNKFMAINTRNEPHHDNSLKSYNDILKITSFFEEKIKKQSLKKLFNYWAPYSYSNLEIKNINKFKYKVSKDLLKELLNI